MCLIFIQTTEEREETKGRVTTEESIITQQIEINEADEVKEKQVSIIS